MTLSVAMQLKKLSRRKQPSNQQDSMPKETSS
jgi:hypothetical protein